MPKTCQWAIVFYVNGIKHFSTASAAAKKHDNGLRTIVPAIVLNRLIYIIYIKHFYGNKSQPEYIANQTPRVLLLIRSIDVFDSFRKSVSEKNKNKTL